MFALITGCSAPPRTDVVVIFDQTEARNTINTEKLLPTLNIEYGSVTITEIIDQSFSKDTVITRLKSPSYLFRVESTEREKDKKFTTGLMKGQALYNRPSEGLDESHVYSVLARSCKKLSRSNADQKRILVFGDMFHHVKGEFSFYAYRENPSQIMESYDQIVEILERDYPDIKDADLTGIGILVIYYPNKENDRLYREVRKFWSRYFTGKNVRIEFVTNLPYGSQISAL